MENGDALPLFVILILVALLMLAAPVCLFIAIFVLASGEMPPAWLVQLPGVMGMLTGWISVLGCFTNSNTTDRPPSPLTKASAVIGALLVTVAFITLGFASATLETSEQPLGTLLAARAGLWFGMTALAAYWIVAPVWYLVRVLTRAKQ